MKTKLMAAQEAAGVLDGYVTQAVFSSFVPGSTIILTAAGLRMAAEIARCFEVDSYTVAELTSALAGKAAGTAVAAKAVDLASEVLIFVPILGPIIKAGVAAATTRAVGEVTISWMWARSPLLHELKLLSRLSGRALDVAAWRTENGSPVQVWDYGGGANQRWTLRWGREGSLEVRAIHSARALDVPAPAWSGHPLQIWDYCGGYNQNFRLHGIGDHRYRIECHQTGHFLTVSGAENGATVRGLWRAEGAASEWELWPA